MGAVRFQLPMAEGDLWEQVIMQRLSQKGVNPEQVQDHLALLEHLAFEHLVCAKPLSHGFVMATAEWVAEKAGCSGVCEQVHQWLCELEAWGLLVHAEGKGTYQFAIPMLIEFFVARHLVAQWAEDDHSSYRNWLPQSAGWWHQDKGLRCPNPGCRTILPPFREFVQQGEFEEVFLLFVELLRDLPQKAVVVGGIPDELALKEKALSSCRWSHPDLAQVIKARPPAANQVGKRRWLLPAVEDDLWRLIVVRLLEQRDVSLYQATFHLRLLEEMGYHSRLCDRGLTYGFAIAAAAWLAAGQGVPHPQEQAQQWLVELEDWNLLVRHGSGPEATYEFAIPTLDEYFAARYLATRWYGGGEGFRPWLPCAEGWWKRGEQICPNLHRHIILPSFNPSEWQEEMILLVAGVMEDATPLLECIEEKLNFSGWMLTLLAQAIGRAKRADDRLVGRTCSHLIEAVQDKIYRFDGPGKKLGDFLDDAALIGLGRARMPNHARPLIEALIEVFEEEYHQDCEDSNSTSRMVAAEALGRIGDASAVPALAEALKDKFIGREAAVKALGQIGDASAVPALVEAMKDKSFYVREAAVKALRQIGDVSAVPALAEALKDKGLYIRQEAAEALGQIRDAEVSSSVEALKDEGFYVREAAVNALDQIGDVSSVPALIEALNDKDSSVRWRAAGALGHIGDASAVPALSKVLKDKNKGKDARMVAANALGRIGDASVAPALIEALKDEKWYIRQTAAEALGKIGSALAIPALNEAFKDKGRDVRRAAAKALRAIGEREGVRILRDGRVEGLK